jgi:hypothetical protein
LGPDSWHPDRLGEHGQREGSTADSGVRSPAPAVPPEAHCSRFAPDLDPDEAHASRRSLLADAATTNALVLGTHFAGTSAGRILSAEDGYRFVPETRA